MTGGPADPERAGEFRAARWIAGVSAFFWAGPYYGLTDLITALSQDERFADTLVLEAGWGLLFTVLVAGPLVSLCLRPGQGMLLLHLALVALAMLLTGVVGLAWALLVPGGLLAFSVAFMADLARGSLHPDGGWRVPALDVPIAPLVLLAVPPAVVYTADMVAAFYRDARPEDVTMGVNHWPVQAALAVAAALVALLVAAGVRGRWPGTMLSAVTVAVNVGGVGAMSLAHPDLAASLGEAWGVAAVVWSIVFMSTVAWRLGEPRAWLRRRARSS